MKIETVITLPDKEISKKELLSILEDSEYNNVKFGFNDYSELTITLF